MRTLQIGMTASRTFTSGTDRYFLDLLRALPPLGVGVRGVVLGDPASLDDPVPGIESFAPEDAGRLRRWRGARAAIARLLPASDLIVSHNAAHAFPALDRFGARALVVHFHGPWALEGRAEGLGRATTLVRSLQERTVYALGKRFIVLSRAFGDVLERAYGVAPEKIRVVPGGVDLRRFGTLGPRAAARERLGWPLDRPICTTVRRLVPSKGIENFIDAIALARRDVPDVLAIVVGTGPLAADLQRRVAERGLAGNVRFAGHVSEDDLVDVYRASDVLVVPTIAFEGFGLVVVEALACGTPALVTPVGGLPEVVSDLDAGLILQSCAPAAIARGIAASLSGERPLPGADACTAYARRFDWPQIAARVRDVYREVA